MAYVSVPKDLTKVKSKVMFGLTKRQLICFGTAVLIGVPLFFLLRGPAGNSVAAMRLYFLRPKKRPYKTNNFYAALARQDQLDREVYRIVQGKKANACQGRAGKRPPQADPRRAPGDRRGHPQGGPDR